MNKKLLLPLCILPFLFACNAGNIQESMFGLQTKPYTEPTGENLSFLIVEAPALKRKMMIEDKITVSLYNSCTDSSAFRSEGYIGGFNLSSKESIGKTKTVAISTDQPLFVEVGYSEQSVQCTNKFRVLPAKNSTYKIHWEYSWGKCSAGGQKLNRSGSYVQSDEIVQKNNQGSFWNGGSGRTTSEWRTCEQ